MSVYVSVILTLIVVYVILFFLTLSVIPTAHVTVYVFGFLKTFVLAVLGPLNPDTTAARAFPLSLWLLQS